MDKKTYGAIAIAIGDRFYKGFKNKRIQTAHSLAGAKLFGWNNEDSIKKAESILQTKGYKYKRMAVELSDVKACTNMDNKLKMILKYLEWKWESLVEEKDNEITENTADYFLQLGRVGELGNAIDYIEKQYEND